MLARESRLTQTNEEIRVYIYISVPYRQTDRQRQRERTRTIQSRPGSETVNPYFRQQGLCQSLAGLLGAHWKRADHISM